MPKNAHPDSTFSSHLHNDWTQVQTGDDLNIDSDSDSDDEQDVQIDQIDNFAAWESEHGSAEGYERVVPDRFSEERDDTFMKSLIENYAIEMKDKNGKATGNFFFDKKSAQAAA